MLGRAALVASLVMLAPQASALAQDAAATEEARGHFERGTRAFDTGDYELAVTEFQRAYELTQHPDLLFNIYSSAERAGQIELALASLERFLAEGEIEPERRPVLEERLANLRQRLETQRVEAAPEPEVTEPEPAVPPTPEPEAAEAEPAPGGVHPAGVGVLIAAGVLAASFGVLAALSEVEDGNLTAGCGATRSCTSDQVATLNALNIAADVSWIAAAAAGVAGLVLLFALPPEPAARADVAIAPWASPDAAGLTAVGSF